MVIPAGNARAGPAVIDLIADFIRRFVVLPDPSYYRLVATWIVGTYLVDVFEYFGYLFVCSTLPQSGKSKLLEVLDQLVYRSSGILISPTEAILFRTAGHTQLIDEIDSHLNVEALRNVLNAGFQRGASVYRCERAEGGGYDPKPYSVYGARALAGIGRKTLHETTRQRTFIIEMVPQPRAKRERFRSRTLSQDISKLCKTISEWVAKSKPDVISRYERERNVYYLEQFQDRTVDVAEPLAAIVETMFADRPELADARADLVIAVGKSRQERDYLRADQEIIQALRQLATDAECVVGTATELAKLCDLEGDDATARMSNAVRRYGFETTSTRKSTLVTTEKSVPKHRYRLSRGALDDVLSRYFGLGTDD